MVNRIPDYFDSFSCLMGACPDTCCGQWEIVVDPQAKARYRSVEGPLGDRIRAALTVQDGEDCMVLDHGRCPLLTEDGLCAIVLEKGENFLSTTCHTHPRFTEIYGGLQETMLSISCPEAARLLLDRTEPLTFLTRTDDTPVDGPNDLDPDLFQALMESRTTAFSLVQNRDRPMSDRLALLLCFARRIQSLLDREAWTACERLSERYLDPSYQNKQLVRVRRLRLRRDACIRPLQRLIRDLLRSMEHLTKEFPEKIETMTFSDLEAFALPMEQLLMYFLFRWWLKAVNDGLVWRQGAACVVSCVAVAGLAGPCGSFREAARLYSKEVEHAEENMALLRGAMDLDVFSRSELLRLLEVPHAI